MGSLLLRCSDQRKKTKKEWSNRKDSGSLSRYEWWLKSDLWLVMKDNPTWNGVVIERIFGKEMSQGWRKRINHCFFTFWPRWASSLGPIPLQWNSIRRSKVLIVTDTILFLLLQLPCHFSPLPLSLSHLCTLLFLQCSFSYSILSSKVYTFFYLLVSLCLAICTTISFEQGLCAFSTMHWSGDKFVFSYLVRTMQQKSFRGKSCKGFEYQWVFFSFFSSLLSLSFSLSSSSTFEYLLCLTHRVWRTKEKAICIHMSYVERHRRLDRERAHTLYT